ncbi:MAG: Fur family transcriptional regulator [Acidimicrobiales bacterium]
MQSSGQLIEHFRAQGLKVTPQRQCIFEALVSSAGSHPTAEAIWAEVVRHMPAVSLKTVYQTLNDLSTMGVVSHLAIGTGSARFDTNVDRHQHVVCTRCNRVWDVYVDLTEEWIESKLPSQLPEDLGGRFLVSSSDLVVRGLCGACADDSSSVDATV